MKVRALLSEGARQALRHRRLVLLLYVLNLAFAAVVVAPLAMVIAGRLVHSLENDRLFADFDPSFLSEAYLLYRGVPFNSAALVAAALGVLFLFANVFLAGGAIAVFHREDDTFFGACARFFGRMFRILLLALIAYAAVSMLNNAMSGTIERFKKNSMEAWPWAVLHWGQLVITGFLLGVVNMIFDYAKIVCVAENRRGAIRSAAAAFRFVFRNPGGAFRVYWTCTAIGLLFLLAYHGLSELIGQASPGAVLLLFLVRQAYMVTRMWTRLWTWASEVRSYDALQPTTVPVQSPLALIEAEGADFAI